MVNDKQSIICIGGANIDRKAKIIHDVRLHSSNPVTSVTTCGGVARNIAEYLGRLGCNSFLIAILGDDREGEWIQRKSEPFVQFNYMYTHPSKNTGSYTAILDPSGDMVIGIADMGINDDVYPTFIDEHWQQIGSAQLVVLDTNYPKETITHTIKRCYEEEIPLAVVPGSAEKTYKLPKDLHGVTWLIVNKEEATILASTPIKSIEDTPKAAQKLINMGVKNVVITHGAEGLVYTTSSGEEGFITPPPLTVEDVTGAGDAFVSGFLYAQSKGLSMEKSCKYGMSCSILCVQTDETVPSHLDETLLNKTYREYFQEDKL